MKPAIQAPRLVLWNIDQTPVEGGTVAGGLAGGAVELASSLYSGDDTLGGTAGGALSTSNSHHADHAEPSTAGCPPNTHGIHGLCLPRAPPSVDQRRAGPGGPSIVTWATSRGLQPACSPEPSGTHALVAASQRCQANTPFRSVWSEASPACSANCQRERLSTSDSNPNRNDLACRRGSTRENHPAIRANPVSNSASQLSPSTCQRPPHDLRLSPQIIDDHRRQSPCPPARRPARTTPTHRWLSR
jgi:hypothetical protein